MAPLVHELASKIPTEFQLPQDIRSYFKDGSCLLSYLASAKFNNFPVGTGPRGAYQDASEIKPARFKCVVLLIT